MSPAEWYTPPSALVFDPPPGEECRTCGHVRETHSIRMYGPYAGRIMCDHVYPDAINGLGGGPCPCTQFRRLFA